MSLQDVYCGLYGGGQQVTRGGRYGFGTQNVCVCVWVGEFWMRSGCRGKIAALGLASEVYTL